MFYMKSVFLLRCICMCVYMYVTVLPHFLEWGHKVSLILSKFANYGFRMNFSASMLCLTLVFG